MHEDYHISIYVSGNLRIPQNTLCNLEIPKTICGSIFLMTRILRSARVVIKNDIDWNS